MPKDKSTGKKLADMMYGSDQMRATPQSRITGPVANALRKAQQFASQYELDPRIPLLGGTGVDELLSLPEAASLMEDVSYNGPGALIRGGNAATGGLGTFRPDPRITSAIDVAGTATGVGQLGAMAVKAAPGALKAGARNLSAPRTLHPQAGAIVFHGSPHKFDKFSSKKIGTGEGAQAYGHGLYFAESPEVAKTYQPRSPQFEEKLLKLYQKASSTSNYPMMEVLEDAMMHRTPNEIVEKFTNVDDGYTGQHVKAAQDFANWYSKNEPEVGGLYTVDLPDEKIARMLDYDKPLSQQPQAVQSWLKDAFNPYRNQLTAKDVGGNEPTGNLILNRLQELMSEGKKADVFTNAENFGARNASQELFDAGIPGIRYLDEQSRGSKGAEGTSNFVVFPGEEDALRIIDRKAEGGSVRFSDNPDVMQLELAGGGAVRMQAGGIAKLAKLARAPAKSKQEIQAIAERMAPQVTGEYVRESAKSAKTVAGKTQKQFQREKNLPVDVRATDEERIPKTVDIEKLKDEVMIGIPGDPTLAGKTLYGVGDVRLGSPSPQHGGPLYGLYNDPNFWASGEDAAKKVQNLARSASELYDAPVLGNYIMMGPDSLGYAQHFADANLQAIDLSKMTKQQIEMFNEIIREGYNYKKKGERFQRVFPSFPGIEDKDSAYLHMAMDPDLRKHFNEVMQKPTVTEPLNLPSGQDIRFAITEPALRDMESGVTGYSIGRMRPDVSPEGLKLSQHPTYSHDIPGQFMGTSKYPMPYELTFPDTVKSIRENPRQAPYEFGTLQYGSTHQTIDQQMIDEIKAYEERMKQLTGKKAGGAVRKAAGGEITADDLILEERKL
jgi:hypothetical protein